MPFVLQRSYGHNPGELAAPAALDIDVLLAAQALRIGGAPLVRHRANGVQQSLNAEP